MTLNTQVSNGGRNAMIDALAALADGGYIDHFTGAQPAGPGTAITTQVKVSRNQFGTPAFAAASAGVAVSHAVSSSTALATGTAAWFRVYKADGTTAVWDGTAGTSGTNSILNSTAFVIGAPVDINSVTLTEPAAGA